MQITKIGQMNNWHFEDMIGRDITPDEVALGAIYDGKAAGAAVFTVDDDVCFMDHIFVRDEYRRKGIAGELMDTIISTLIDHEVHNIICYFEEDKSLFGFFRSEGFAMVPQPPLCSIGIADVASSAKAEKIIKMHSPGVVPFDSISGIHKKTLINELTALELDDDMIEEGHYDGALSFAYIEDNALAGVLLASKDAGDIMVNIAATFTNNEKAILYLMSAFFEAAKEAAGDEGRIYFAEGNESMTKFMQVIVGEDGVEMKSGYAAHNMI